MEGADASEMPLVNGHQLGQGDTQKAEEELKSIIKEQQQPIEPIPIPMPTIIPKEDLTLINSKYRTIHPDGSIEIRMGETGIAAEPPVTVPDLLNKVADTFSHRHALATKKADGTWDMVTYKQYKELVRTCAKAFIKLGLEKHHSVCILGFNSVQWFVSDLAAIHAGGFATGIYTTNNSEACFHILDDSNAHLVIVEDTKQMDKILSIWDQLPNLKAAIQWDGNIKDKKDNIYNWEELMEMGVKESDEKLDEILKSIKPNECCTLVYTSGTTGKPKGVMLSHDNLTWETASVTSKTRFETVDEVMISYLPLSHIAAQILDIYIPLYNGVTVYFANKDALKGSLIKTLQEVQPTRFLGVPRIWEKLYEKMNAVESSSGFLKKLILNWAKSKSLEYHSALMKGETNISYGFMLARMLVMNRVKAALGFSNCLTFFTAAAPLSADVKHYFMSMDIPVMEVFGMSESGGAHCCCTNELYDTESIGTNLPGAETKIINPDPNTGEGEICMKGRHIFMGYLNNTRKTVEALDDDGWLHSGDVGKIDDQGRIFITGRIKELIITAGGENVAPVLIENELKKELPCISHAVVIGDKGKFLSVLFTFKTNINMDTGMPEDTLTKDTMKWLKSIGCEATTVPQILDESSDVKTRVFKAIDEGIARANERAISHAQKVHKFAILPKDLSIPTGELGPTLKLKRNVVVTKYASLIKSIYKS